MLETLLKLAGTAGLIGFPAIRHQVAGRPLADRIDALLPQTQCGQCGYPGCRPYAEAIAAGEADINQCPPGGEAGIRALADLLDREPRPLNRENGVAKTEVTVARIDEARCIGCVKCVRACPVDAIIGAPKQMHTVVGSGCTGCELCLDPCPVDCIDMVSLGADPVLQPWAHEPSEPLSPLDEGLPRPVLWAQEQSAPAWNSRGNDTSTTNNDRSGRHGTGRRAANAVRQRHPNVLTTGKPRRPGLRLPSPRSARPRHARHRSGIGPRPAPALTGNVRACSQLPRRRVAAQNPARQGARREI